MFQQAHIAGHQCRRKKSKHLPEREVPRHYREHNTERIPSDIAARVLSLDKLRRENRLTLLCIIAARSGTLSYLGTSGRDGLSHLHDHQLRKLVLFSFQKMREAP